MISKLLEIKERFSSTTYGHWKIYENEEGTCIGGVEDHPQLKSPAPVVTMAYSKEGKKIYINKDNAEFIAHSKEDMDWLIEQAEKLNAIANAWMRIEESETELTSDFYNEVQDILSESK